jgi:hypothetical protein
VQPQPGCIVIEADLTGAASRGIAVGSHVPVQFVTESGFSLPTVTGTVVTRSRLRGTAGAPDHAAAPVVRLEILLHLKDLARPK